MTQLKIIGKPSSSAHEGIEPHVKGLFDAPGRSVVGIIEMRHDNRTQPAPGSDKEPSVQVKIIGCEVATAEQVGVLRQAQRALYLQRTARGTLDEDGELQLGEQTLKQTAGMLTLMETARLRAGLGIWEQYARRVVANLGKLTETEIAHEMKAVADGLGAILAGADQSEQET